MVGRGDPAESRAGGKDLRLQRCLGRCLNASGANTVVAAFPDALGSSWGPEQGMWKMLHKEHVCLGAGR